MATMHLRGARKNFLLVPSSWCLSRLCRDPGNSPSSLQSSDALANSRQTHLKYLGQRCETLHSLPCARLPFVLLDAFLQPNMPDIQPSPPQGMRLLSFSKRHASQTPEYHWSSPKQENIASNRSHIASRFLMCSPSRPLFAKSLRPSSAVSPELAYASHALITSSSHHNKQGKAT